MPAFPCEVRPLVLRPARVGDADSAGYRSTYYRFLCNTLNLRQEPSPWPGGAQRSTVGSRRPTESVGGQHSGATRIRTRTHEDSEDRIYKAIATALRPYLCTVVCIVVQDISHTDQQYHQRWCVSSEGKSAARTGMFCESVTTSPTSNIDLLSNPNTPRGNSIYQPHF